MSRLAVVVPVKSRGHKTRLSGMMSSAERALLAGHLLDDTLANLKSADLLSRAFIVSADEGALRRAEATGAGAVKERRDAGVNAAVRLAISSLSGSDLFLVLPSDIPLLSAEELHRALALRRAGADVVIAPSSTFNGTNLLLFSRDKMPELSYDKDSFWNHLASCARRGYTVAVTSGEGLMADIDEPADVARALKARINRRSLRFLKSL